MTNKTLNSKQRRERHECKITAERVRWLLTYKRWMKYDLADHLNFTIDFLNQLLYGHIKQIDKHTVVKVKALYLKSEYEELTDFIHELGYNSVQQFYDQQ